MWVAEKTAREFFCDFICANEEDFALSDSAAQEGVFNLVENDAGGKDQQSCNYDAEAKYEP